MLSVHVSLVARPAVFLRRFNSCFAIVQFLSSSYWIIIIIIIIRNNKRSTKVERSSTLKRTLLLIVVGTEARGTSRDMDNVQMIGTKITAIKEYLYVRHSISLHVIHPVFLFISVFVSLHFLHRLLLRQTITLLLLRFFRSFSYYFPR